MQVTVCYSKWLSVLESLSPVNAWPHVHEAWQSKRRKIQSLPSHSGPRCTGLEHASNYLTIHYCQQLSQTRLLK
uniref:Uncharacterized protein n=1 Tax=Anguilla anguilla TaxID=7936 RepID=A0A0E9WV05_ANGAN